MTPTTTECDVWALLDQIPNAPNLRKLFLTMTRAHLTSDTNYGPLAAVLAGVVWSEVDALRKLRVDLQHEFTVGPVQDQLPAIFFGLGKIGFSSEVVANYAGHSADNSVKYEATAATAPMQWVCLGNSADLASNLAETVFSFFSAARSMMIEHMGLRGFDLIEMDMPVRIAEADKAAYYRVDMRGVIYYNHVIGLHTESHRLKKIVLESTHAA